jgi:hypothetical protein
MAVDRAITGLFVLAFFTRSIFSFAPAPAGSRSPLELSAPADRARAGKGEDSRVIGAALVLLSLVGALRL